MQRIQTNNQIREIGQKLLITKKLDERDKIIERKANEIDSEESEIYERDQTENPQSLKSIDDQQSRENVDLVDTDMDTETDTGMEDIDGIT